MCVRATKCLSESVSECEDNEVRVSECLSERE